MANVLPSSAVLLDSSSSLPQSQLCSGDRIRGIARRVRCSDRSVVVTRMSKGKNDVKLVLENEKETKEEEPLLLRIGVALVTELLRVFSSFGRAAHKLRCCRGGSSICCNGKSECGRNSSRGL